MKNVGGKLALLFVFVFILLGYTTENGKLNLNLRHETQGQKHWFVTPDGTGDCSDWDHACTINIAASKCSDSLQDVIWLGAGLHDTDNGVDATGLIIDKDYVKIMGISCPWAASSKLCNGDAAATSVLTVTGDSFQIDDIMFSNIGQVDENVIYLTLNGIDGAQVNHCRFNQDASVATAGTGILVIGDAARIKIEGTRASFIQGTAIDLDNVNAVFLMDIEVVYSITGVDIGDNLDFFEMENVSFDHCTTGVIIGSGTDNMKMNQAKFIHNTTNLSYAGVYDGLHLSNISISHPVEEVYPTTTGITLSTGDGTWVWSATTTIVPLNTIPKAFSITGINVQNYDASQTYKIELFYGGSSPATNSLGIYEFTVGSTIANIRTSIQLDVNAPIPKGSEVGMKLMSSTTGVDDIVVTVSYAEI